MTRPLPSMEQRQQLCRLIQAAFVEIRALGWAGRAKQAGDLADLFHNLSMEMWGRGGWDPELFRKRIRQYQATYHGEHYDGRRDYLAILDEILRPASPHSGDALDYPGQLNSLSSGEPPL